ncbi:MAG: hypothetical protein H7833_18210 [Magnetococcus sp. DMHC-1]|nr:hypothetical protein [Magnetococcales bacterium]
MRNGWLRNVRWGLLAVSGLLAGGGWVMAAELPVRSVALFTSGVGYVQHAGELPGGETLWLPFQGEQINDVLKSLVLQDVGGGEPGTVIYPARDPIGKTLGGFQVNLAKDPGMAGLLGQMRGARVLVEGGGERQEGVIVGVEKRPWQMDKDGKAVEDWLLNLVTEQGLRSFFLRDLRRIEPLDPALRGDLTRALETLDQGRGEGRKRVAFRFPGAGLRKVRIGYVVETPVWKTSYRLLLPEPNGTKATLQGWAIVENQSDNDWHKIQLSLVSGRPISFVQDLYEPLYAKRPEVKTQVGTGPLPPVYGAGMPAAGGQAGGGAMLNKEMAKRVPVRSMAMAAPAASGRARHDKDRDAEGLASEAMDQSAPPAPPPWEEQALDPARITAVAAATEQGALFQYTVADVSLPRRQSAMLPIVADPLQARLVSIYNRQVLDRHPLAGVWLENTTGKHLPAGPVTLYQQGSYGGDARLEEIPPGQKRLLSFAVDLAVKVKPPAERNESRLTAGRVVKGVLELTEKRLRMRDYTAENTATVPRTLIVEHPVEAGWQKSPESPAPLESTPEWQRFETTLPPGVITTLTVREERIERQRLALLSSNTATLLMHADNGALPEALRGALRQVMGLQKTVQDRERDMEEAAQRLEKLTEEQGRLRENLAATNTGAKFHDRIVQKLEQTENEIERWQTTADKARQAHKESRDRLERFLESLNVG